MVVNVSYCDNIIYNGTICGWAESATTEPIPSNGFGPRRECPSNYSRQIFSDGFPYCYRTNTAVSSQKPAISTKYGGLQRVFCNRISTRLSCPNEYSRNYNYICYKDDPMAEDTSGIFVAYGMEVKDIQVMDYQ